MTRSILGSNTNLIHKNKYYAQHPEGGLRYSYNQGVPNFNQPRITNRQFLNSLERIEGLYTTYSNEYTTLLRDVDAISQIETRPFQRDEEISSLQEQSKKLQKEIELKINRKEFA